MRIVSLLPSTTEIIAALGKKEQLVGRSHECDFPEDITSLPVCTEPKFNPDGSSYEIDERVKALLQEGLAVYRVDENKLADLNPDVIITQDHCEVCAASVDEVKEAVHSRLGDHVQVVSVSPTDLSSVVNSIRTIAKAIKADDRTEQLMNSMKTDLLNIQQKVKELRRPKVLAVEWLDPLMSAGNWMPELIQLAGGQPLAAEAGKHSPWIDWEKIRRQDPELLLLLPCGYSIDQTLAEIDQLTQQEKWASLRAVKNQQVFILDGNQYFNRPGPRLVDSTRILAEVIHPALFRGKTSHKGWINLAKYQFRQSITQW